MNKRRIAIVSLIAATALILGILYGISPLLSMVGYHAHIGPDHFRMRYGDGTDRSARPIQSSHSMPIQMADGVYLIGMNGYMPGRVEVGIFSRKPLIESDSDKYISDLVLSIDDDALQEEDMSYIVSDMAAGVGRMAMGHTYVYILAPRSISAESTVSLHYAIGRTSGTISVDIAGPQSQTERAD